MSTVFDSGASAGVVHYQEAVGIIRDQAELLRRSQPAKEEVPLLDSLGRVLASPILADRDQPPFPRSTRDGYACIAADLVSRRPLRILGQLRAGETWQGPPVRSGEAIEIMTGAPVPDGADCVVMVEHTLLDGSHIRLAGDRTPHPGENIVLAGAEAKAGAVIVPAGTRLAPPQIAAAAACGYSRISVFQKPRVAVLATGDELVSIQDLPLTHQIRNSNSESLAAQIRLAGADPIVLPPARDHLGSIADSIRSVEGCGLLLLSGGVSMGKYDLVEQVLDSLGAKFFFTGAKIQPGRPVVFGHLPSLYFFGLPGNPVSTLVTFSLFVSPLLAALSGEAAGGPRFALARLAHEARCTSSVTRFLPAQVNDSIEGASVTIVPWQGSGDLASTASANAFAVLPDVDEALPAGSLISVLLP
ncbi:MAG: molybdopterin molybdotransferase MoeA [Acidobacterium ailaaui]|nr:molybdopterin molybdotransferase MoeA [Pseudacidobacterium ailaaui]